VSSGRKNNATPVTKDEISRGEKNGENRYFLCNLYLSCFPRYYVSIYEMSMRFQLWDIVALTKMSLYCRRATGSDADRDRGADTVVELSIGVSHYFVHILGVNENSANDRRSHPSRYVSSVYANAFSRPPKGRNRGTTAVCTGHKKILWMD